MITQKWWFSPVFILSVFSKVAVVLALFLSAWQLNVATIIVAAVAGIIQVISDANNPTNPKGFGANEIPADKKIVSRG